MTEPFIGIDFGTCNSSAAWFNPRTGQAEELLNAEGDNKTPSVVYFGPRETVVGRHAEERLDRPEERKRVLSAVKRDLAKPRAWVVDERRVTPLDAATLILGKIKRDAEQGHFHEPMARAVITCPAVFDEAEKDKLREAAALAGFRDVALLEEPVAAAVAYAEAGIKVGRFVLVYDLGGGTFDLALLAREEGDDAFRLAMEPRGERIGGEDFDRAIYDYFDAGIRKKTEQPICPDGLDLHLLRQCRRLKESLSASEQPAPLSWHWPGKGRLELKLNRARFESLVDKHVERTLRLTRSIQEEAVAAGYQLDSVILIGGSSRTPCIVRRLQETLQVEPRKWLKQDVAVALGAAYHAQRLWGERPSTPPPLPPAGQEPAPESASSTEPSAEAQGLFVRACARFDEATKSAAEDRGQHLESAMQYAQAACDLDPRWPDPFQLKGRILQEKGEWHLAVAAYTASLRLDLNAAGAHQDRGFCKFMAGENKGARKDFDEALRLLPTELAYRYRAATNLRLGDAAAAVIDIQNGLPVANQDTPRAALHAVCGLLLRDELRLPKESIASFAEALRLMPSAEPALERQFLEVSRIFQLMERMKVQPAADARFAWIQQELWQACKTLHGGCTRAAAIEFLGRISHEIDDRLWKDEPELAWHLASIWAEKQKPKKTLAWLKNLLAAEPLFDIGRARCDPWVGKLQDPDFADFLTPKWSYQEHHGQILNWLTVTNLSPFRLSALQVRVQVTRRDGNSGAPKVLEQASLAAGSSKKWPAVFEGGGWFGGNVTRVHVTLSCAEGEAKLVGTVDSAAVKEMRDAGSEDIMEAVVLGEDPPKRSAPRPRIPKDDILDVVVLDEDSPKRPPKLPENDIPDVVVLDDDPPKRPARAPTPPKDDIPEVMLADDGQDRPAPKRQQPTRRQSTKEP